MATWWVNQGATYDIETRLGLLWAPVRTAPTDRAPRGTRPASWTRMLGPRPGDSVIHYADQYIRGWSTVTDQARDADRPYESVTWGSEGRRIAVRQVELDMPIPMAQIPLEYRLDDQGAGSPFDKNGDVILGYLYEVGPRVESWLHEHVLTEMDELDTNPQSIAARAQAEFDYRGDSTATRQVRAEQKWLRDQLFPGLGPHTCDLCGRTLPKTLLVAAHIKPRSSTTWKERTNARIAFRACSLGCDLLFERGFLTVNAAGLIEAGPRLIDLTADVVAFRSAVIGRSCTAFGPETARYFADHARTHTDAKQTVAVQLVS